MMDSGGEEQLWHSLLLLLACSNDYYYCHPSLRMNMAPPFPSLPNNTQPQQSAVLKTSWFHRPRLTIVFQSGSIVPLQELPPTVPLYGSMEVDGPLVALHQMIRLPENLQRSVGLVYIEVWLIHIRAFFHSTSSSNALFITHDTFHPLD